MSAAESTTAQGGAERTAERCVVSSQSVPLVSNSAEQPASESASNPNEKPAGDSQAPSEPPVSEADLNGHQNQRDCQEEAAPDMENGATETADLQQQPENAQQGAAGNEQTAQLPVAENGDQEAEGEEDEWEEVEGASDEEVSDAESNPESGSESDGSDDAEKRTAKGPTEGEEHAFGCSHYRRKCKIVAPCW